MPIYRVSGGLKKANIFIASDFGIPFIVASSSTEAAFQTPGSAFLPNTFIDISEFFAAKLGIIGLYRSESQADPLPRGNSSIEALARFRGATIGVQYAEAFMLLREVG